MDQRDTFVESVKASKKVVDQIRDDQWNVETPSNNPEQTSTLRNAVNSIAYDMAWVPDMMAGRTMDEAGRTKFDGDLLGDDPKASFAKIADDAIAAVRDHNDLDTTVHCSYADYPARNYLTDISSYYGMTAYDNAKAIGVDPTMPPALVEGLWEQLQPVAEEWRAMGIFGPKVDVPDDADLHSRLLGLMGLKP